MESGGHGSQVINDDNCNTHIGWQMPQQTGIRVKATRRTAHANDRKIFFAIRLTFIGNHALYVRKPFASTGILPGNRFINPVSLEMVMSMQSGLIIPSQQKHLRVFR